VSTQKPAIEWKKIDFDEIISISPERQALLAQHFLVDSTSSGIDDASIPPLLDIRLPVNEHEVSIAFIRHHLLPNGPIDLGLQELKPSEILATDLSVRFQDAPVFAQAILSFAIMFFGAQHRQGQILNKGYAIYGIALRSLNQALSTPGCHLRDDVLISVVTFAMLEGFVPSSPKSYLTHILGLERLLELRDPTTLKDCSYRTLCLYKGIRHMILFASLRGRRPSILARPEWKAVLRTGLSLEKPQEQEILSILADCSVLIAASDEGRKYQYTHDQAFAKLQAQIEAKAMELLWSLLVWKEQWNADKRNVYTDDYEVPTSWLKSGSPPVPSIYRFKSQLIARMFMLYNTVLSYVLSLLPSKTTPQSEIYTGSSFSQTNIQTSIANGDYRAASRTAGLDVARSVTDYLAHKRVRGEMDFTSLAFQWAVTTAWDALDRNASVEGEWLMWLVEGEGCFAVAQAAWEI
jgi:hypothetical protein